MIAKKCDRCGTYYDSKPQHYSAGIRVKTKTGNTYLKSLDLCDECVQDLERWINKYYTHVNIRKGDNK